MSWHVASLLEGESAAQKRKIEIQKYYFLITVTFRPQSDNESSQFSASVLFSFPN